MEVRETDAAGGHPGSLSRTGRMRLFDKCYDFTRHTEVKREGLYLQHHARSLIFSASMPPSAVATVLAAMDVMEAEPQRRERLWAIAKRMIEGFHDLGFDTGSTKTPIVPVMIGPMEDAFRFWKELFERGVYTNAVLPPAVPEGSCRLRTSYIATHTDDQLDFVLEQFAEVGKKLAVV